MQALLPSQKLQMQNTNTRINTSANTNILRTHTYTAKNAMKYVIMWQVSKKVYNQTERDKVRHRGFGDESRARAL